MPESMNLSINGHSQVPPGFRFHPTEEELLNYYLRKKVANEKIDLDVIREVDLNKLEPWDIQEKCRIGSTPQNDWYFFSHKDKKYPTGTRTNRATAAGFWKATGRDKIISSSFRRIGLRKTLVFYKGRAPHGQKSDWIMHEYRLDDGTHEATGLIVVGEPVSEEGWVVCRVFRKKNYQKTMDSPKLSSSSILDNKKSSLNIAPGDADGVVDQILLYMGKTLKTETDPFSMSNGAFSNLRLVPGNSSNSGEGLSDRYLLLPGLGSPNSPSPFHSSLQMGCYQPLEAMLSENDRDYRHTSASHETSEFDSPNWVALDRLVASQLNGSVVENLSTSNHLPSFDARFDDENHFQSINRSYSGENDLWCLAKSIPSASSSNPLCHLPV